MSGPLLKRLGALATAMLIARVGRAIVGPPGAQVAPVAPTKVEPPRGFALGTLPHPARVRRGGGLRGLGALAVVVLLALGGYLGWSYAQSGRQKTQTAAALARGDPSRGPAHMLLYGCAGCHETRGVPGPKGQIGPPLTDMGKRIFIVGLLDNTPENLVRWIRDPKGIKPDTAMPQTGISDAEARDVAAYLLAL